MKLIFFNRFFFPDTSATSQILSDLAFHLAASGKNVQVITSRLPGTTKDSEVIRGVEVHRVADALTGHNNVFEKGVAYLKYVVGAREAARRLISPGDIVIVKTDPPLLSSAIGRIARKRRAAVVLWLQDLFPEVAREYGIFGMGGVSGTILRRYRNSSMTLADRVVVIGANMAERVRALRCVPQERISIIHNWADGRAIAPLQPHSNPLRKQWDVDDLFIVGYSGNLGRVHEFDTLLGAAVRLKDHVNIRFLIIGRGTRLREVEECVARMQLANIQFQPHQERAVLCESLSVPDVHISILRPDFEGLVHPSKLYGIMAAGRPTIFIGKDTGETGRILAEAQAGLSVPTGDSAGLAAAILRLRDDPVERRQMGENARRVFESEYDMPIALAEWERLLSSIWRSDGASGRTT